MSTFSPQNDFTLGFDTTTDIFGRKKLYDQVLRVIKNATEDNLVIALDDQWGNGKTSFVKMMESEIKINEGDALDVIYFDAFENDYQEDPFITLSSKIYSMLGNEKGKHSNIREDLLNASKKLGKSLLINGAKFVVSTATSGLVNNSVLEKTSDLINGTITDSVEGFIEEKIKSADIQQESIIQFKKSLEEIHKSRGTKVVFIIDELDRARPDFSLELLEKIKHLFSVEGFIFLLVMNRDQFEKSIEKKYGRINSRLYLNKFIHFWFSLPKKRESLDVTQRANNTSTIKSYLINIQERCGVIMSPNGTSISVLGLLLDRGQCSLREAERCLSVMSIIDEKKEMSTANEIEQTAFAIVAYLKVCNPMILDKLIDNSISLNEFLISINLPAPPPNKIVSLIGFVISYHLSSDNELKEMRKNDQLVNDLEGPYGRRVDILRLYYNAIQNMRIEYL